jgi:hypothetical protein
LTGPDGSTGDEAVANLCASYALIASKAIEAEINAINELEIINETPLHTKDKVISMTPLTKLDPIESFSLKTTTPKTTILAHTSVMTLPQFIFSPPSNPHYIPWTTIVSDACCQMILNIPGNVVNQI